MGGLGRAAFATRAKGDYGRGELITTSIECRKKATLRTP